MNNIVNRALVAEKKIYIQPSFDVLNIQFGSIVCASGTPDIGFGGNGDGPAFAPKKGSPIFF